MSDTDKELAPRQPPWPAPLVLLLLISLHLFMLPHAAKRRGGRRIDGSERTQWLNAV